MATYPQFNHIHCSSRFDRTAESLETALDGWMSQCSLVTLTEVNRNQRAATMREQGWDYFNSKLNGGQDNCGIAWRTDTWMRKRGWTIKLTDVRFYNLQGRVCQPIYAAAVVLQHKVSGHRVLINVTHMPAHIEGSNGWRTTAVQWRARKQAYIQAHNNWSTSVNANVKAIKPDAVLVIADWNLNLKVKWVRDFFKDHWSKTGLQMAWKDFPTGGTLEHRIIDATMYQGVKVTNKPQLLPHSVSSDHTPYKESFQFLSKAESNPLDWSATGTTDGAAWWGFGDYDDDEIYSVDRVTGDAEGNPLS